jgi:hypothetical protein
MAQTGTGKKKKYLCVLYGSAIISLNSINQFISVMVKCGVLFEGLTEVFNTI